MLVIIATQKVKAQDTTNLLSNGSFDDQTTGWELDGNVAYDGNNYGDINKSVRFSGSDGGSITQSIQLDNIAEESKEVTSISGSLISIGCNNEGSNWCTQTGTENNLDPVNITMTLSDGTNSEVLTHNFTSDYNDGVITTNYSVDVTNSFETANTSLTVNYAGLDTGNKAGQFGTIIDDLSLSLTLSDIVIAQEQEVEQISQINASDNIIQQIIEPVIVETVQIGSLDATSIVNTISSGIIEINPPENVQIATLSPQLSITSDIRAEQMNIELSNVGVNNEMPTLIDTGAEVPVENDIPEIEMPDLTDMPTIEMPEIEMPSDLPEINDIQIESVSEPEPETLQEIREEIPESIEELPESLEELPTELEEVKVEEDLKENQNEQKEETSTENAEVDGKNEESELSEETKSEEKESETKEELAESKEKESEEKEESAEKELKDEPTKNEEKVVKTAKTTKTEKKQGSESQNKGSKKTSVTKTTPKIKSDIVVQEIDIKTIVSFNKEYFAKMEFYDGEGFNSDYTQANTKWSADFCQSDCWGNMVLSRPVVKIEQFRR